MLKISCLCFLIFFLGGCDLFWIEVEEPCLETSVSLDKDCETEDDLDDKDDTTTTEKPEWTLILNSVVDYELTSSPIVRIRIYRGGTYEAPVVRIEYEPLVWMQYVEFNLKLGDCYHAKNDTVLQHTAFEPGVYGWNTSWERVGTECTPFGTLLYNLSTGSGIGDGASLPFEFSPEPSPLDTLVGSWSGALQIHDELYSRAIPSGDFELRFFTYSSRQGTTGELCTSNMLPDFACLPMQGQFELELNSVELTATFVQGSINKYELVGAFSEDFDEMFGDFFVYEDTVKYNIGTWRVSKDIP